MKEQEACVKTADVYRKHGISDATFYKLKAKYGGLKILEARRLKALGGKNARLKRLLARRPSRSGGQSTSSASGLDLASVAPATLLALRIARRPTRHA